jgi:predicted dehydrogenase
MVRFGCLGAARITPGALITPVKSHPGAEVVAIAARSAERARRFAADHSIAAIETDYAALIKRPDVDAIYNALPPHRHADLTIMALEAGKPVLCEKPMAMNADEAIRMAEAAKRTGKVLMEAFHYRFHPVFAQAADIVCGGDLGRLQTYEGHFSVEIPQREGELRHELALGGGALMDLGCYPLHWARTLLQGEPEVLSAKSVIGREGIDLSMQAEMVFDRGVKAQITTSMAEGAERAAWLQVTGSEGVLRIENPIAPHNGHRVTLLPVGADEPIVVSEAGPSKETTYHYQLDHFLNCLSGEAEPMLLPDDAVANMTAIDAIYKAAGMHPRGAGEC